MVPAFAVNAAKLDSLFMHHMVLQRGKEIPVFGTARPGDPVEVLLGEEKRSVVTDPAGRWKIVFGAREASSFPVDIRACSGDGSDGVSDVLIGDVWLCTGQSNMDSSVKDYSELAAQLKNTANPLVRLFNVRGTMKKDPQSRVLGEPLYEQSWLVAEPASIAEFSAVGICFGLKMQQELGVPVGLVESAVGATAIEAWLPAETLAKLGHPYTPLVVKNKPIVEARNQPSELYNGMIHPLLPMKYKGIIWYQGEANAREYQYYAESFKALIQVWRERLGDPDVLFYFAQLSAYGKVPDKIWAHMREAQEQALELPSTGRIVTIDLGEYGYIHPADKAPVGERFARLALNDMGVKPFVGFPEYQAMKRLKDRIEITFRNAGEGLKTQRVVMNRNRGEPIRRDPQAFVVEAGTLQGFEIAGSNRVFVKATAEITGKDTVQVWSDSVADPAEVRYAWDNFPLSNLFNSDGMPAAPFRTGN
jgi:sialate O-acetylesterase